MTTPAPHLDARLRLRFHKRFRVSTPTENSKHMKIYNVIHVYDVYVVAESEQDALAAAHAAIRAEEDPQPFDEAVAIEVREQKALRAKWLELKPIVGAAVSDDDFEKLKGKTTSDVFDLLHKHPANTGGKSK